MKQHRLFYKYVVPIIGIVVAALAASGAISIYFSYQETRNALVALQHEKAVAAAARIENFVREIEHQLGWTALPQIVEGTNPFELRRFDYVKLGRQVPSITEASYISPKGCLQVQSSRLAMDRTGECLEDLSRDPRFTVARTGKTYFGPVHFRKETEPYMAIAMRAGREGAGVTAVEVNLKFIWEVVRQITVGKKGHAYVVDGDGHLVAHPDISLVLQKTDLSMLPQVKAASGGAAPANDERIPGEARDRAGGRVLTAHARIEPLDWTVFVEQPMEEAYAPLYAPLIRIGILLLLGLVLATLASLALARYMVRPINALREGAVAIAAGNLDQRIDVRSGDELQDLADQFNNMAAKLQESYAGLERKVEERTAELQDSLERQQASAEVLHVISGSVADSKPVFEKILESCERLFGGRNMGISLVGEDGKLHMGAYRGPRPEDFEAMFPMPLDENSGTGTAIIRQQALHYPDVEKGADVPGFVRHASAISSSRSIIFAPMLWEGRSVGAIYIGRDYAAPFSDKDIALLKIFADQAAIAVQNARLFREIRDKSRQLSDLNSNLEKRVSEGVAEMERLGKMKRFLSPQVADLIMKGAGVDPLKSHRREITVAFLDLRGFTAFTEASDPAEVMGVLREYHAEMGRLIMVHQGTLERFAGDGIMIFFNDPVPLENPAAVAVRMALEMQQRFGEMASGWKKRGYDLGMGIGIAEGFATLGAIGFEERWDYGAIGNVTNVAARLCSEAKAGQVLISQRVMAKVEKFVAAEPIGELPLKGLSRPIMTFNVRALRS